MFGRNELKVAKGRFDNTLNQYNNVMKNVMNKSEFLYNMKKDTEQYLPTYSNFIDKFKVKPSNLNEDYQESLNNIEEYHQKQKHIIDDIETNILLNDSFKKIDKNRYFNTPIATLAYTSLFSQSALYRLNSVSCVLVDNPLYDILLFFPFGWIIYLYRLKKYNLEKIENFNKACAEFDAIIRQHNLKICEIDEIISNIQQLLHNLNMYFLKLADYPRNYNELSIEQKEELGIFVNLYKTLSEYLIKEIKLEEYL